MEDLQEEERPLHRPFYHPSPLARTTSKSTLYDRNEGLLPVTPEGEPVNLASIESGRLTLKQVLALPEGSLQLRRAEATLKTMRVTGLAPEELEVLDRCSLARLPRVRSSLIFLAFQRKRLEEARATLESAPTPAEEERAREVVADHEGDVEKLLADLQEERRKAVEEEAVTAPEHFDSMEERETAFYLPTASARTVDARRLYHFVPLPLTATGGPVNLALLEAARDPEQKLASLLRGEGPRSRAWRLLPVGVIALVGSIFSAFSLKLSLWEGFWGVLGCTFILVAVAGLSLLHSESPESRRWREKFYLALEELEEGRAKHLTGEELALVAQAGTPKASAEVRRQLLLIDSERGWREAGRARQGDSALAWTEEDEAAFQAEEARRLAEVQEVLTYGDLKA